MTNELVKTEDWTPEQMKLITEVVAKKATPDELKLFLYRCKHLGLDPLTPGEIYFIKYNDNTPGNIVIGIDGFRSKAARTNKLKGIKRGIIYNKEGHCVGAWAEVYREGWDVPAREEVALHEYNTGKAMWAKMPETMIKKVAEAAALRMAFPNELGGIYAHEEMDQAERKTPTLVSNELDYKHKLMKELSEKIRSREVPLEMVKKFTRENFNKETSTSLNEDELEKTLDFIIKFTQIQDQEPAPWEKEAVLDPRIVK